MYDLNKPINFHIELTDQCNARCPLCPRNIIEDGRLKEHPNLKNSSITIDQFKNIFKDYQQQTDKVLFSGNFGDPIFNSDICEIIEYTSSNVINHASIYRFPITICTNGGFRSPSWWKTLAEKFPNICVIFSIDGLEDTHHLYRVNTRYERVVENARAFINAGGYADWSFIKFGHNEHQEEEARRRASEFGFHRFHTVTSQRFKKDQGEFIWGNTSYKISDVKPKGFREIKNKLNQQTYNLFHDKKNLQIEQELEVAKTITCEELDHNRVYIDCEGHLYPCCWLGSKAYNKRNNTRQIYNEDHIMEYRSEDKVWEKSFLDILNDDWFQYLLPISWQHKPCDTCAQQCGKYIHKTYRDNHAV